jgi:type IV pilus assembly protein PilW
MVSVTLALLVTLAALGVLLFSRQGGAAMEQATALRDNSRFATELIRRIVAQTGFESFNLNSSTRQGVGALVSASPIPDIEGFNNALVADAVNPVNAANGSRSEGCGTVTDSSCVNGSDVLILRFQGLPDGSMINCSGVKVDDAATAATRPMSAFHLRRNAAGEPTLICTFIDTTGAVQDRELVEGVESFQVLYGVDNVSPKLATPSTAADPTLITRYLRADEMVVQSSPADTQNNWRRVRAIRIGMILRGPKGSAISQVAANLFPLGASFAAADDAFSTFPAPADGRLRQEVTFTVHLRNYQGQDGARI